MNVLFHGRPFCTCADVLPLYTGPHDIRTIGIGEDVQYRYDPVRETFAGVMSRVATEWAPDLIVCWIQEDAPPPRGIEDSPILTVATVSDWDLHAADLEWNLARYDVVLMDILGAKAFNKSWVTPRYEFPLYSQTSTIHKLYGEPRDIDILFVGSICGGRNDRRARYLERVAKLADRYRVLMDMGTHGEAYGRLMNRAKIVFNFAVRGELNLRFFETIAAGAVAFIEEDNVEAPRWCEEGRHYVAYNARNLEEKLAFYLAHDDEREVLAAGGLTVAPRWAAENRFDELIEWAARQPRGPRRFRELPTLEQDYHTALMYRGKLGAEHQQAQRLHLDNLLRLAPNDPRGWALLGYHFMSVWTSQDRKSSEVTSQALQACLKAFNLDSNSSPYALNAATALNWFAEPFGDHEAMCLATAIEAGSLAGAELVVGAYNDTFFTRWQRAVAEGCVTLDMVRAEAHIRLARILAKQGRTKDARAHFETAADLDPENINGIKDYAEALWRDGCRGLAIQHLAENLNRRSFDFDARLRLVEMMATEGLQQEAQDLLRETQLIMKVFPQDKLDEARA